MLSMVVAAAHAAQRCVSSADEQRTALHRRHALAMFSSASTVRKALCGVMRTLGADRSTCGRGHACACHAPHARAEAARRVSRAAICSSQFFMRSRRLRAEKSRKKSGPSFS